MIDVVVSSFAVSATVFSLVMNKLQPPSQSNASFSLLLVCFFIIGIGPLIFSLTPWFVHLYVSVLPLTFFSLFPCLWFYQEALISPANWQWRSTMWWHCLPLPFMAILGVAIYLLPNDTFQKMFFAEDPESSLIVNLLSFAFFLAVIIWSALSCIYLERMFRRTMRFRNKLKNIFSEHESRDLKWLSWVSLLVIVTWTFALLVLTFDSYIHNSEVAETAVILLFTALVWLICLNGLRQRPCLEDINQDLTILSIDTNKKNYERSALKAIDLEKIGKKLSAAIQIDKIYLNSDVNLSTLANHIKEPPQYVTQTLSQQLDTSFFDLINRARVDDAKVLLTKTKSSVLDIALSTGFNSRSSFYRAFRQFTGVTPTEYRKNMIT